MGFTANKKTTKLYFFSDSLSPNQITFINCCEKIGLDYDSGCNTCLGGKQKDQNGKCL
jgi:hypothetical protein